MAHVVKPVRRRKGLRLVGCPIVACALLLTASSGAGLYARQKFCFTSSSNGSRCAVGAGQMRGLIDAILAQPHMITEAEKEFVREQHERFSCAEYTKLFEQTNYYKSPGKRAAMIKWHRETFHSRPSSERRTSSLQVPDRSR